MTQAPNIDGVLIQWGDRLFYPGNRTDGICECHEGLGGGNALGIGT